MSPDPRQKGVLGTLFLYEIKMLLRDRRMILISVVVPLVLVPAVILIMNWVSEREQERLESTTVEYAVTGSRADFARTTVSRALALREESGDSVEALTVFEERTVENPDSLLTAEELHLVVEGLSPDQWDSIRAEEAEGDTVATGQEDGSAPAPGPAPDLELEDPEEERAPAVDPDSVRVPVIRLHYRDDSQISSRGRSRMRDALRDLRASRRETRFREAGFPLALDSVAPVVEENIATAQEEAGALVGRFLTIVLVMLMLGGGSIVAADAISGEKERGTLETLLTTAARRWEIVGSKQLAIIAVGLTIALINVVNLLVWVGVGIIDLPEAFAALTVTPLAMGLVLVLFVPLAVLIAAVLLLMSGYAKTYKEFQIYFFPVYLLSLVPAAAPFLPGIELASVVSVVPIANVSVAAWEVLQGEYAWPFLALTLLSTGGVAAWASRLTVRTLSTERLVTAAELDRAELEGGPALFPRRVLQWFGVMWALLLIVSVWYGPETGIRTQIAVNILGIFFVGTLLMIRRYRLDPKKALALRSVHPSVWLAVLVGAPSAHVLAFEVFRLADLVFPVPERMLESFGQFLLPETLGLWQILLFLCVIPGIFEELAFRGVLLHGLRKRFHPVVLCLVVGGIFGLFHVSLFRLIPTGYLGVVLAAVTVLTGSIFPAMLWHALNNAAGLVPAYFQMELEAFPPWATPAALAGMAVAFWLLWRHRRPYPGLRGAGEDEKGRPQDM